LAGEGDGDDLGVGDGGVRRDDEIHACCHQPTRIDLEDRCPERTSRVFGDVATGQLDGEQDLFGGVCAWAVVDQIGSPGGQREHHSSRMAFK
jgi:hypothetical protein